MRDRAELEERFGKAEKKTDELIDKAARDISNGGLDPLDFKLALSGIYARAVNVEALLAITAEMTYRLAFAESVRRRIDATPENPT